VGKANGSRECASDSRAHHSARRRSFQKWWARRKGAFAHPTTEDIVSKMAATALRAPFCITYRSSRRCVIGYAPIAPAVLVLIVSLQDANKIGHAGSIAVFRRNRNPGIGRGLAALPKSEQEIGDFFHGVLSATDCGSANQLLERQRAARSGEGRRARRRRSCPATAGSRPVPLLCLPHSEVALGIWLTPLHAGMKRPY
jgi:hypothetical protein